jgi:hypothetical protein
MGRLPQALSRFAENLRWHGSATHSGGVGFENADHSGDGLRGYA